MFITRIAKNEGSDIAKLRAGHKSVKTTERYIHYTVDDMMKENYYGKKTKRSRSNSVDQKALIA